ncbi:MAG: hypothetical protein K2K11_06500 [Bacteroidales bacterium]|nr:hypothetical protein [Bacteroidales bacterium]
MKRLERYNPSKLWPPFIRAYRQNATGQRLSPQQEKYLRYGNGLIVFVFAVIWFIFYLPYFQHQADTGFFAYTHNFVRPFFDSDQAPRVNEFLWRFVSQFYMNVPLIVLVVGLMVWGFYYTCKKTVGPYTPFLLPLFFLLFPSYNLVQASTAISLWLIMAALTVYFSLTRLAARHPNAILPRILMHTYAVVAVVALYYVAGYWALLFAIAVTLVHLIGLPMSLGDKKEGLLRIRCWSLGITLVLMTVLAVVCLHYTGYVPFKAPWYVWAMIIVYGLACIPGLVLHSYNNRKVYIYEWKKRQGEVLDGKPALSPSYNVLLSLIAVCVGLVLFLCSHDAERRAVIRVENALQKQDYAKSLAVCERYFSTEKAYPGPFAKKTKEPRVRARMEDAYKYSLLMEGRLNQDTLVKCLFAAPAEGVPVDNYIYISLCNALGLSDMTLDLIMSRIDGYGMQNRYLEPLLESSLQERQYDIFRQTLYYTRRTLNERSLYHYYRGLSKNLLVSYTPEKDGEISGEVKSSARLAENGFIDEAVKKAFESQEFSASNKPDNIALLEYYTFLVLQQGDEGKARHLAHLYTLAGFEALPARVATHQQ